MGVIHSIDYTWTNSNVVFGSDTTNGGPDKYNHQSSRAKGDSNHDGRGGGGGGGEDDDQSPSQKHQNRKGRKGGSGGVRKVDQTMKSDQRGPIIISNKEKEEHVEGDVEDDVEEEGAESDEAGPMVNGTQKIGRRIRREMKPLLQLKPFHQVSDARRLHGNSIVGQTYIHSSPTIGASDGLVLGNIPTIAAQHACAEQIKTVGIPAGFASLVVLFLVVAVVRKCGGEKKQAVVLEDAKGVEEV